MANLKDTIVLGNLTVTGKVVASDILANGTGNEFDTIKVNSISAKDGTTIEVADILNEVDLGIATTGALTLQGNGEVVLRSNSDVVELESPEAIQFIVGGTEPMIISGDNVSPNDDATLGTYDTPWPGAYIGSLNTSWIGSVDNASAITIGSSTDSLQVNSGAVQFANSITTPGLSYGGTLALEGEAGTSVKTGLYPSGTANLGASNNSFSNVYGTTVTTTSTYADTVYTKKIRARQGASTGTSTATGQIQMEPSTYGWKLSGDSNISTAYRASLYPGTNGDGRIGQDLYHFGMSYINYMCVYTIYPMNTTDTTYGADKGRIGTSTYYFNAGYIKTIYRTTESSLSDVRLKTNITNNTLNALNVINQLDIIDFKYLSDQKSDVKLQKERSKAISTMKTLEKTKETKELRKQLQQIISTPNNSKATTIGISAQQLESLLPPQYRKTFITKESTENYSDQYYLKENRLVYLAMKAIQEQQEIIDKLQARIEILEQGDK